MSHVTKRGSVKPTLNITPLIDVVFLLIVFFMIVSKITTDEQPEMQLPDLDNPETHQAEGEHRVIINIVPVEKVQGKPGPGLKPEEVFRVKDPAEGDRPREVAVRFLQVGGLKFELSDETGNPLSPADRKQAYEDFVKSTASTLKERFESGNGEPPLILLRCDAAVKYQDAFPVLTLLLNAMSEGLSPEVAANTPVHIVAYLEKD